MVIKMAKTKKSQGGRPEKPIDYSQLPKLCAIHCTGEECAAILDCSYEHLNNSLRADGHGGFLDYFKKHSSSGKASLRRRQYKAAVEDGNVAMMIWLGKQYLGQREPDRVEAAIPAQAINIEIVNPHGSD